MAKFVIVYRDGATADMPGAVEASMTAWMNWFGTLGSAVTDFGNPFSSSTRVDADGSRTDSAAGLTGYSIIEAESLDAAAAAVANCPNLAAGGSLEIYEAIPL